MLMDPFAFGNDRDSVRQVEFSDTKELDQWGNPKMAWILTEPNDTVSWKVSNNVYSISPEGQAFFTKYAADGVTGEGSPFTDHQISRIGSAAAAAAFVKENNITLTKAPKLMTALLEWYRSPSGGNKTKATTNWNSSFDYNRTTWQYLATELDASYQTTSAAYTGAEKGYPAGDLNWFPAKKTAWENDLTPVEGIESVPSEFTLSQNYPNPFNPATLIQYSVPTTSKVKIEVFDVLGSKVATLIDSEQPAGKYTVNFNASRLSSGVYFYQLSTPNMVISKKMILIK